jgi:hypothetical protein
MLEGVVVDGRPTEKVKENDSTISDELISLVTEREAC